MVFKLTLPSVDASLKFDATCATLVAEGEVEAWGYAFEKHLELLLRQRQTKHQPSVRCLSISANEY